MRSRLRNWGASLSNQGLKRPCTAAIFGCGGLQLSDAEKAFFREVNPLGFILFQRNVLDPNQVRALTAELRQCVDNRFAPIFIDQEGGRVQRLKPPHWRAAPPAAMFGKLHGRNADLARRAVYLNSRLIGAELAELGIDADCAPVLDVRASGAHDIIGDRAFSINPAAVADLGGIMASALLEGGLLPVAKHLPGHGRSKADSHEELPVVDTPLDQLDAMDFLPFRANSDCPLGMTAHIVYKSIDPDRPATMSTRVIEDIIRGDLGFGGLLMTDDLSMKALSGDFERRATESREAGCDLVLHCNGDMAEMRAVAKGAGYIDAAGHARWHRAQAMRTPPKAIEKDKFGQELDQLLAELDPRHRRKRPIPAAGPGAFPYGVQ